MKQSYLIHLIIPPSDVLGDFVVRKNFVCSCQSISVPLVV